MKTACHRRRICRWEFFLLAQFLIPSRKIVCKRVSHLKQPMSLDRKNDRGPALPFPAVLSPRRNPHQCWWCFSKPALDSKKKKKTSQGVTTWYPQSDGMSEGSTDGGRCSCWGTSWPCNLATALVGMFVPVLLNRRVKGSFPALETNGLGQLVSLQINFLILQEKSCIFHVAFQEHFQKHIPQKGHLGLKHLRFRYFPVSSDWWHLEQLLDHAEIQRVLLLKAWPSGSKQWLNCGC